MRVRDIFTKEEIKDLCQRSAWRGGVDVAITWGLIFGALALAGFYPRWYTIALAIVILGGRHLALAILMHEASHRGLSSNKWANDFMGQWLCAAPGWLPLLRYREHHIQHHAHTASDKDPDLGLTTGFPASRMSLLRKVLRDLSGLTGLKRAVATLMMDVGLLTYSASTTQRPVRPRPSAWQMMRNFGRYTLPTVLTNGVLFMTLFTAGIAWTYGLWVVAWLTTFSLFLRIRSAAEHACVELSDDPLRNTRTVHASLLARLTVAPHHVNYHLEHHLLMTAPHYNLPRMHRMLKARGVLDGAPVARNYLEVFALILKSVDVAGPGALSVKD